MITTSSAGPPVAPRSQHMVVCGDDGLARRLAVELDAVCGETVTVVLPSRTDEHGGEIDALHRDPSSGIELLVAARPDEQALRAAGVDGAAALALTYGDDRTNMMAALLARSINPSVRLVIRMYHRERGRHLEQLLDRAVLARRSLPNAPSPGELPVDTSTTVLSDSDTAVPELVAAAALGHGHTLQVAGKVFRGVVRPAGTPPHTADLATLAVFSGTDRHDPLSEDSAETPGTDGTQLLPDTVTSYNSQFTHGRLMLEEVSADRTLEAPSDSGTIGGWLRERVAHLPWKVFVSREMTSVLGLLAAVVALLSLATWATVDGIPLWKAVYLPLLDIFTMGDPATGEPRARKFLQLIAGFTGIAILPLVVAATINATGAFRAASISHPPADDVSDHIVLVGLGKVGTRVLVRLRSAHHRVVAVERDPQARGVAVARELGVPLILEDATGPRALDLARIAQSASLLVLTSDDSANLDIVMAAREANPDVRAVMRLYDDDFAATVSLTLRASYPEALTRSRSVSSLASPAFAAAMMGRHVLGVMPVERGVLLFTSVDVAGHPALEGRSVHEAFARNEWRVLAVGPAGPGTSDRSPTGTLGGGLNLAGGTGFDWRPAHGRVLRAGDRVVLATTRRGLDVLTRESRTAPDTT
ncbi:NAD-binding protein [Streptomyces sp. NBC_00102]|uniref:NAD-binding protein n=1 Tax=Streptomyces sp. NBC_00102 TaxID=2975652 RepID=UPI002257A793|nr:NAD-binding protein [Streptomyces sp. NBC_00102]MCX5401977.1 NAD-binding protein [Streptomyces sp. NBC_00102]